MRIREKLNTKKCVVILDIFLFYATTEIMESTNSQSLIPGIEKLDQL